MITGRLKVCLNDMRLQKLKYILYATGIAMLLHTIEEYMTKLYDTDFFIVAFSRYFNVRPISTYTGIQILVLSFILVMLVLSLNGKFNKVLGIALGLIYVGELSHPYIVIMVGGYYSGLYTGILLVIIGYFYWKEVIKLNCK